MDKNNTLASMLLDSDISSCKFDLDNATIAKAMKGLRLILEKALKDIENQTGISYQQVRKYEMNKSKINIDALTKIFDALGYSLSLTITKKN
jgi:transcriptional regulator with XRE-family HTH domain